MLPISSKNDPEVMVIGEIPLWKFGAEIQKITMARQRLSKIGGHVHNG